jgi:rhodanese-related sulfurtransferase
LRDCGPPLHITAVQLALERRSDFFILDTRPSEQFASPHIRGSIQTSLKGHFASWADHYLASSENRLDFLNRVSTREGKSIEYVAPVVMAALVRYHFNR